MNSGGFMNGGWGGMGMNGGYMQASMLSQQLSSQRQMQAAQDSSIYNQASMELAGRAQMIMPGMGYPGMYTGGAGGLWGGGGYGFGVGAGGGWYGSGMGF
jgi:hypothetical protein